MEDLFARVWAWGLKNCNYVDDVLYFLDAIKQGNRSNYSTSYVFRFNFLRLKGEKGNYYFQILFFEDQSRIKLFERFLS